MEKIQIPNTEILKDTFDILDNCVDGYFFMYSLEDNTITISQSAVKKFNLPGTSFKNAMNVYRTMVHPEDFNMVAQDLMSIGAGAKDYHNLEYRLLDKNGNTVWIKCSAKYIQLSNNMPKILIGLISEIGNKSKADNISGFLTDLTLETDYNDLYEHDMEPKGFLMSINIDGYNRIFERNGPKTAEELIKIVGDCIDNLIDKNYKCYKGLNSNFIIMNTNGGTTETATKLLQALRDSVNYINVKNGYKYICSISAGVILFPEHEVIYKLLIQKLNFALKQSNLLRNDHFFVYNDSEYVKHIRHLELSKALQNSVKNDFEDFELYYQPIFKSDNLEIIGAEALLRWHTQEFGMTSPGEFIPILEETGLIVPVGRWVLKTAIKQCKKWQKFLPSFKINVNLSHIQLNYHEVMNEILFSVTDSEIDPSTIVLEFTESGNLMTNHTIKDYIDIFNKERIHLALDDFGTGYSNLLYLKELKINTIKIDRGFVESAIKTDYCFNLISHIISMAHSINISVCLEGIENQEELDKMSKLNPDYYQGYYFSKPIPAGDFSDKYINKKE